MKILFTCLLLFFYPTCSTEDVVFSSQDGVLRSGVKFVGRYVGSSTDNTAWSSPESCTQITLTRTVEQFVCSSFGDVDVEFTLGSQSPQTFTLSVERNNKCYTWGTELSDTTLSIWVYNNSGQSDASLSFEFYALGESPQVTLSCDKTSVTLQRGEFNFTSNKWELQLDNTTDYCSSVRISGIPVVLNGCTVADLETPVFRKSVPVQSATTSATSNKYKLCTDYCGSGVEVYLNNSRVLISADSMQSYSLLNLDHAVVDCGVTVNGTILLLVENGDKILILEDFLVFKTLNLEFTAEHITVNTKCVSALERRHNTSSVAIWSSTKMSILHDSEITQTITSLPGSMTEIIAVSMSYFGIEVLMGNESDYSWFTLDYKTGNFSLGVSVSVDCSNGCASYQVCPHISWLEAENSPYFVTANGRSISSVLSYVSGETLTTSVLSMAISAKDEFAILSTDGILYLGYCSRSSVVKVADGFSSAKGLLFDTTSSLYLIDNVGNSVAIPAQILLKEVLESSNCPLKDFRSSLSSSLIYLDKGEIWSYNVSLTTTNYHQPGLLYQLYPQGHASVNISSEFSASRSAFGENHFYSSIDVAGLQKKGLSVIIASPEVAQPQCSAPLTDVTYVVVDCPKSRHLVVRNKPTNCDQYNNMSMSYTIPATSRVDGTAKTVDYDLNDLGCPISWAYDEDFLPDIWIYDNGVPTRPLCSDFTIREINSRSDYNLTLSVGDAGCRRDPQTWSGMGESWGPDNYQNCFDSETKKTFTKSEANKQYEILNGSCSTAGISSQRINKISFGKLKANYTFEVVVLDPSASYCKLTTKFSVWIIDAPNASDLGIIVLFLACVVMLIILALSYCHYKKTILAKANFVLQS